MIPGLNEDHAIAQAVGAPYEETIPVDGIKAGNILLAVIGRATGQAPVGFDVSTFEVANGSITSEVTDTDGYTLTVIYTS